MRSHSAIPEHSHIPEGVDPHSWLGFEEQIRERRFRTLIQSARTSIESRDLLSAHSALEEARRLKPHAPEITQLERRFLAAAPPPPPPSPLSWSRAAGAAMILVIGIAMNLGVELLRPMRPTSLVPTSSTPAAPSAPVVEPLRPTDAITVPAEVRPIHAETEDEERGMLGAVRPVADVSRTTTPPRRPGARPAELPEIDRTPRFGDVRPALPRHTPRETPAIESESRARVDRMVTAPPRPGARAVPDSGSLSPGPPASSTVTTGGAAPGSTGGPAPETVRPVARPSMSRGDSAVEESRVADVLRRYARAYAELDARAARAVWPSVDEPALARAFQNLASQNLYFEDCRISVQGETASASCRGEASYVGKVGGGTPRVEPRAWEFELRRDGDDWKIAHAEARQLRRPSP